jgi:hypothetical protein
MSLTTENYIYSLEFFNNIIFNSFDYSVPKEVLTIISELSLEVGAPNYVKTPVFQKRDQRTNPLKDTASVGSNSSTNQSGLKKRKNRQMESGEDWDITPSFQATKIEQTTGIQAQIDTLRSYLNKLTDKNYNEYKNKVLEFIDKLKSENTSIEEMSQISFALFEIASTNRFYSKMYADLYTDIITQFNFMRDPFDKCLNKFMELFDIIEYVEPAVDYDKFCKINKDNEKRKSLSTFFVNLMNTKIISETQIILITRKLLNIMYEFISVENKKNEVDELAENIAILYKKDFYQDEPQDDELGYEKINGLTITEVVEKIANSNVKEYPSITKKTIFKFMDLIDM